MITKTALLVIDAQKVYTDPESEMFCPDARSTIERINKLIKRFQDNKQPVIYIRHAHKVDGSDLGRLFDFTGEPEPDFNFKEGSDEVQFDERLIQLQSSPIITKTRYSAFVGTGLDSQLKKLGIERVVVCGFMTNFCCESTARTALDMNYYVDFITDATGTPGTDNFDEDEVRRVVSELLSAGFARIFEAVNYLASET